MHERRDPRFCAGFVEVDEVCGEVDEVQAKVARVQ